MAFSKQMTENLEHFKKVLQTDKNFDVVYRVIDIAGRKGCLFCVDGFTKDEVLLKVLQSWWSIQPDDMPEDADGFPGNICLMERSGFWIRRRMLWSSFCPGLPAFFWTGMTNA